MSTPLPGQIRCPTCHRSTPPAAFCTQCGTAIPASARARPRGLDREELQDRIRVHRPGDAAFRRGSPVGEGYDGPPSPYQPFQPEPEDELVLPGAEAGEAPAHVDNTPPGFDDRPPPMPVAPTPPVEPPAAPPPPARIFRQPAAPVPPPVAPVAQPAPVAAPPPAPAPAAAYDFAEPEQPYDPAEPYDYRYPPPDDEWRRGRGSGSGMGPLAIGGFVLLGILAIAVGAVMAGLFGGGGVAVESPSGTPLISVAPSATVEPSLAQSTQPSVVEPTPGASGGSPLPFPDGFTARTEPCAEEPSSQDGCNSSGSTVSSGSVWVWIGFRKGNSEDLLSVSVVNASGQTVGDGSLALGSIGCSNPCSGWARFRFNGLAVGNYTIRVERNETLAAQATFTVTG
jgi:hypothetical protein